MSTITIQIERNHSLKKINLDIVINTPKAEVDMQYGLQTLRGTSDVVSLIAEAILLGEISGVGKRTHRSNEVRTMLKLPFKGSYGQRFCLEISKPEYKQKLRRIGDDVFLEVLSYFILEALYLDSGELSPEASTLLDDIGQVSENLFKRVKRPLIEMHKISKYYKHNLKLRYKKRGNVKHTELVCLTEDTSNKLTETSIGEDIFVIEAIIIRYHSKTGNGRLHVRGGEQFFSFGFGGLLSATRRLLRTKLSENLHINNLLEPEQGSFIQLRVKTIALPNGDIVKYLIVGLLDVN
ncbi:MAG: hypothetical protein ACJAS1_005250 [Oleiphilaceae bacterium]|jgi:hypothetical protein